MKKIKIIDAIMGSGKTYDAIKSMNKNNDNFIYVTPFLNEVERIKQEVSGVVDPKVTCDYDQVKGRYTTIYKRANLLRMANNKVNMATTHSLFQKLEKTDYNLFTDYDLILDEVIQPMNILGYIKCDINLAINQGLIVINQLTNQVTFTDSDYHGKFEDLKRFCNSSEVIYVNNRLLVWTYPPEIFKSFRSVRVLTYLFEGSILAAYFKYYGIQYDISYPCFQKELRLKRRIKENLIIYDGPVNVIGNDYYAFSKNWLSTETETLEVTMVKQIENLIQRNFKTPASSNAFTTFKVFKGKLSGKGYTVPITL